MPSKYFYDKRGSELFEEITRQPEYYLTRVELALLQASAAEIAEAVGPRAHVVEYGSGSGRKTRILLDALDDPVAYTPIEISRSALLASVERLDREFDDVEVLAGLRRFHPAGADAPNPSARPSMRWCSSPARLWAISARTKPCACCARCARRWAIAAAR